VTPRPRQAAAAALLCGVAAAGCGFGAGPRSEGTATLTVTRDYGRSTLVDEAEDDPPASETVIRFLDREAEITTRYGGAFVQSIDGLAGTESDGRRYDWFFYQEAGRGIPGHPVAIRRLAPAGAAPPGAGNIPSAPVDGPPQPPPRVTIEGATSARATVTPRVAGVSHVILAVRDNGTPTLTSYRRIILTIAP